MFPKQLDDHLQPQLLQPQLLCVINTTQSVLTEELEELVFFFFFFEIYVLAEVMLLLFWWVTSFLLYAEFGLIAALRSSIRQK